MTKEQEEKEGYDMDEEKGYDGQSRRSLVYSTTVWRPMT